MDPSVVRASRRAFLSTLTLGATAFTVRGAFAEELARTPRLTESPFYTEGPRVGLTSLETTKSKEVNGLMGEERPSP
jgi:hypothetical protein